MHLRVTHKMRTEKYFSPNNLFAVIQQLSVRRLITQKHKAS